MKRISCCIDMMFSYCDFYDRFEEARKCGMNAVEFWKWTNKDIDKVEEILKKKGMKLSIFNVDCRDVKLSYDLSRGILNEGRAEEFLNALKESIPVYRKLEAIAMIVLIGENKEYNADNVYKCLLAAKPLLEEHDVTLLVEPLNTVDRSGYSMPYAAPVFELLRKINSPHIKMLYDIYHQNMMGDFDMKEICRNIDLIGHFHVADAPGRHEPETGNIDYVTILKEIAALPYEGFVGLEYRATKPDGETFGFLKEAGYGI